MPDILISTPVFLGPTRNVTAPTPGDFVLDLNQSHISFSANV